MRPFLVLVPKEPVIKILPLTIIKIRTAKYITPHKADRIIEITNLDNSKRPFCWVYTTLMLLSHN